MSVPVPGNEDERLSVLRAYQILDTPNDDALTDSHSGAAREPRVPVGSPAQPTLISASAVTDC